MNQIISLTEREMDQRLREYIKLFDVLLEEAYHWWKILQEENHDDLFIRRAVVRATFAFIEWVIYRLKLLLLSLEKLKPYLTLEEIVILREKKYEPDNSGHATSTQDRYEF
jgi:hypothetical protein